jgi:transcriptional regulator with XRE-family HTH domain
MSTFENNLNLRSFIFGFKLISMENNKLSKWIIAELQQRDWSMRTLARKSGMSQTQISNVLAGNRRVTFNFCVAVAKPLGKTPMEMFQLAGLLPGPPQVSENQEEDEIDGEVTLAKLIALLKQMTPAERLEVLRYAEYWFERRREARPESAAATGDV